MTTTLENIVKTAVYKIGGPTKTANKLNVSCATIHAWIRNENVPDIDKAKELAALSGLSLTALRMTK